jgi:hypothetical protein
MGQATAAEVCSLPCLLESNTGVMALKPLFSLVLIVMQALFASVVLPCILMSFRLGANASGIDSSNYMTRYSIHSFTA